MTNIQTWLDQGKTLADQATEGPWEAFEDSDQHLAGCPPTLENLVCAGAGDTPIIDWGNGSTKADAEFIADARTRLPKALNALQEVLDMHRRSDYGGCSHTACDSGSAWPCPTFEAIQDAIGQDQP